MFSFYNSKPLSFYNPNAKSTKKVMTDEDLIKDIRQTVENESIVTSEVGTDPIIIKKEVGTNVKIKDFITTNNNGHCEYDEEKLTKFLRNAYEMMNDALNMRQDEIYSITDDDLDIDFSSKYKYVSLCQFSSTPQNPNLPDNASKNTKELTVSDMVFNCSGTTLAISFYIPEHIGPCPHQNLISFYNFESQSFKIKPDDALASELKTNSIFDQMQNNSSKLTPYSNKIDLDTNSCIKCLDSHPEKENIFIAGSYSGEIYYINIDNEKDKKDLIEFSSKIDSMFYKECVVSVKFVKHDTGIYHIASISEDGRLLIWDLNEKLKYPLIGFNLNYIYNKKFLMPVNPKCFTNSPYEPYEFLVGSYDGNIYKCGFDSPEYKGGNNQDYIFLQKQGVVWREKPRILISNMKEKDLLEMKNLIEKLCLDRNILNLDSEEFFNFRPDINKVYKNAIKNHFEKHYSLVTNISYNYFIRGMFLSTSYDGSLRLYYSGNGSKKYFFSKICQNDNEIEDNNKKLNEYNYYTYGLFSPFKPSLFVSGDKVGKIKFEIFTGKATSKTVLSINDNIVDIGKGVSAHGGIVKFIFNKNEQDYPNIMSIAYYDGTIEIISLSEGFYNMGNKELEKMYSFINGK